MGQITQDELEKEITDVDLVNGLANRFLWLMVRRSKLLPSGGAFHELELSLLVDRLKAAVAFGTNAGELKRDAEAEALWKQIYENLSTGVGGRVGAVTSRAEAQTMRLACIYALLDHSNVIKVIHLKAALDLWMYCFKSARFIFGNTGVLQNPKAVKLLEELKQRVKTCSDGMTKTEVRNFFNRNLEKGEMDLILNELFSNGFIRVDRGETRNSKKPQQKITLLD